MSHELDMSNGRVNMAYLGDTPWHGLGTIMQPKMTPDQWTKAAGLDWEALVVPSQYEFNGKLLTAPDSFHMVRSDTGATLGVMSKRYKPAQPSEVMAFFREFILTDDRFTLETAGSLKGGQVIWALARFTENMSVNGDAHVPYVFLTTSFNGSLATTMQATIIRVVCNNTLTASVFSSSATIKVPHYKDFANATVKADAHERLMQASLGFSQYRALAEALAKVKLSGDKMEEVFKRLTLEKAAKTTKDAKLSAKAVGQLDQLMSAYRTTLDEGTTGNTGWAALNAVTRYVDHERYTRNNHKNAGGTEQDARMTSAWLGSGALMKREAIVTLAGMGGLDLDALMGKALETATERQRILEKA